MKRRIILTFVLFLCLCLLTACGTGSQPEESTQQPTESTAAPVLETEAVPAIPVVVESVEFVAATNNYENDKVLIKVQNCSSYTLTGIDLNVDYINENGDIIDTSITFGSTLLEPGQAVKLYEEFFGDTPYSIRIASGYYSTADESYVTFYFSPTLSYVCDFENAPSETEQDSDEVNEECDHTWNDWINNWGVYGMTCSKCEETYYPSENWELLSSLKLLGCSNTGNKEVGEIVSVGDWTDESGMLFPDSIKFKVSSTDSKNGRGYTKYYLNGQYSELTGCVTVSGLSDSDASVFIRIHLDNEQVYECEAISGDEFHTFGFDLNGADTILIECITRDSADAHCIVAAAVYP